MAPKATSHAAEIISLPPSLISRVDATRLGRELETMATALDQQVHRGDKAEPVRLSQILEALAELNQLDLTTAQDRDRLAKFLKDLKKDAPTIHMSFAAEPPSLFTAKIINWLRDEVHPLMLLDIGLQPSIGAGCIIRTNSKYFDCSIRQHLIQNKLKLIESLRSPKHA
jgi:hypothetical protein